MDPAAIEKKSEELEKQYNDPAERENINLSKLLCATKYMAEQLEKEKAFGKSLQVHLSIAMRLFIDKPNECTKYLGVIKDIMCELSRNTASHKRIVYVGLRLWLVCLQNAPGDVKLEYFRKTDAKQFENCVDFLINAVCLSIQFQMLHALYSYVENSTNPLEQLCTVFADKLQRHTLAAIKSMKCIDGAGIPLARQLFMLEHINQMHTALHKERWIYSESIESIKFDDRVTITCAQNDGKFYMNKLDKSIEFVVTHDSEPLVIHIGAKKLKSVQIIVDELHWVHEMRLVFHVPPNMCDKHSKVIKPSKIHKDIQGEYMDVIFDTGFNRNKLLSLLLEMFGITPKTIKRSNQIISNVENVDYDSDIEIVAHEKFEGEEETFFDDKVKVDVVLPNKSLLLIDQSTPVAAPKSKPSAQDETTFFDLTGKSLIPVSQSTPKPTPKSTPKSVLPAQDDETAHIEIDLTDDSMLPVCQSTPKPTESIKNDQITVSVPASPIPALTKENVKQQQQDIFAKPKSPPAPPVQRDSSGKKPSGISSRSFYGKKTAANAKDSKQQPTVSMRSEPPAATSPTPSPPKRSRRASAKAALGNIRKTLEQSQFDFDENDDGEVELKRKQPKRPTINTTAAAKKPKRPRKPPQPPKWPVLNLEVNKTKNGKTEPRKLFTNPNLDYMSDSDQSLPKTPEMVNRAKSRESTAADLTPSSFRSSFYADPKMARNRLLENAMKINERAQNTTTTTTTDVKINPNPSFSYRQASRKRKHQKSAPVILSQEADSTIPNAEQNEQNNDHTEFNQVAAIDDGDDGMDVELLLDINSNHDTGARRQKKRRLKNELYEMKNSVNRAIVLAEDFDSDGKESN